MRTDSTDGSLATLADVNLAATWQAIGRSAGYPTERVGQLRLFATGLPVPFFNGAIATGSSDDPDACIARATEFMAEQGVPWLLWVRQGVDDALLDAARAAGLGDAGGPPAMGWFPVPAAPAPLADLEIIVVDDRNGLDAHLDLASRAFGVQLEMFQRLMSEATLADPSLSIVVGRVDGEPVSTAVLSVTGTTAGVYTVATPAEHQRRGYGRALTRAAVDEGLRRGCDHAVLQASPSGQPVYEAMGFIHLGRYVQLVGPR